MKQTRHHICMIVPDPRVHGGIASVTGGYYGSRLEADYRITYVQSYCDGSKWDKLRKALTAYRQFLRILHTDPPELVHIHSSFGPSFYRKLPFIEMACRRGIPVVNHIHGSDMDELYNHASERKKKLVRRIYGHCTRMIVLSDVWRTQFERLVPAERIDVVPNYAAAHPETTAPEHMHERFARRGLLFMGVITEGKGVKTFPQVMKRVLAEFPEAVLTVAGVGDVESLFAEADPEVMAHIHFTGWVSGEEKEKLLQENAVFLFPSHMECFSMSILEAQGHAMPVVSCRAGSIPEVVRDGESGYLTEVGDAWGLSEAVLRLMRDEKRWSAMALAGYRNMAAQYTFARHIDRLEAIYEDVLGVEGSVHI